MPFINKYLPTTFLLSMLLFLETPVFAQADSMAVVNAKWVKHTLSRGVVLKQYNFNNTLFSSSQHISILQVRMNRWNRIEIEGDPKTLQTTSNFGLKHEALAALNGTFFDTKNGGSVDYIRVDGKVINNTRLGKNKKRANHQQAAIVVTDGRMRIVEWDGTQDWEERINGDDVMVTGPLLLHDFQRKILDTSAFTTMRHPRTAIAFKRRKILLITVDGRNQHAAGMSLMELASLLKWVNASDAINLDGGGSTTLWVSGFSDGGVVNYPCDNKIWDHLGERPVANVILVIKKK